MLRTRLKFGRLTNDVEIHYPGFNLPPYMKRGMYETYQNTSEVVVEIRSDGKSAYTCSSSRKKDFVQLDENETVMLKTRLCNGQISLEKGKLEFIYPGWTIPTNLTVDLRDKYHSCSNLELYVIFDEKGELRFLTFKEGYFNFKNLFSN